MEWLQTNSLALAIVGTALLLFLLRNVLWTFLLALVASITKLWSAIVTSITSVTGWWRNRRSTTTDDEEAKEDVEHVKTYPWLYWLALIALAGFYGWLSWYFSDIRTDIAVVGINLGGCIWGLGVFHFASGFDIIKRNEIAGVFVLGIPTQAFTGMFIFVPPGIFQQEEVTALVVELPWPEDPTKIFRGEPDQTVPRGYFLPIRVTFADTPEGQRGDDPLNRRITLEVSLFVRIRVKNFFDFYARIGDTDKNIGEIKVHHADGSITTLQDCPSKQLTNAREQIGNRAISLIVQTFSQLTPAEALKELKPARPIGERKNPDLLGIDEKLESEIKKETKGWGIDVVTASVKLIEPSKNLNKAIQFAAEGVAEARGTKARAEGEKAKRTLEGEGDAAAITAKVTADILARAEGLKKMAELLNVPVETLIAQEVARAIAEGTNEKIILPGFDVSKIIESIAAGFKKPEPVSTGGES